MVEFVIFDLPVVLGSKNNNESPAKRVPFNCSIFVTVGVVPIMDNAVIPVPPVWKTVIALPPTSLAFLTTIPVVNPIIAMKDKL